MSARYGLALLCAVMLYLAAAQPSAASGAVTPVQVAQNSWISDEIKGGVWVQFFDQNRRRKRQNRRRQAPKLDIMPLRTNPNAPRDELREFRRQERGSNRSRRRQSREQDAAREAVRRGDILPLDGIIRSAQRFCPGKFLGAKLQRGGNGFSYWVRILRPSGRRIGLTVDARTGSVIGGRCR